MLSPVNVVAAMSRETKPEDAKPRPLVQRLGAWVMGIAFATMVTGFWLDMRPQVHLVLIVIVFVLLSLVLTVLWRWMMFDRAPSAARSCAEGRVSFSTP